MNSMTMEFEVDRQILSRTDNERVVEDSENYLYAHFTFSEDWDGTQKGIIVNNKSLGLKYKVYLNDEDTCKIPNSVIKYDGFEITAFGENENKYVVITSSNLFVSVLKSNYEDAEEPDVKYIISNTLDAQKDGDSYSIEIPNIYFKDVTFANDILTFFGRNNEMLKQIGLPYGLVNDITLNLDQSNYLLTLNAYDKDNNLIFSRSADFNIEQKIFKDIYYDEDTKELVFVTMDDETIRVPIGDILTGIATQEWVNTQLQNYVQKENGKGLSTNDYTNSDKNKLSGIEANAQINVLEGIQLEGVDLPIDSNKKANITGLQAKITEQNKLNADLVDDSNATNKFVSQNEKQQITENANAISNIKDGTDIDSFSDVESALDLKADKSNTYTKTEVDGLLNDKQDTLSGSTSIDITNNVVSVKEDYIDSQFLSNTERQDLIDEIMEVFENE